MPGSRRSCRSPAARPSPRPQPIPDRIGGFGGIDGPGRLPAARGDRRRRRRHASLCRPDVRPCRRGLRGSRRAARLAGARPNGAPRRATAGRSSPMPRPRPEALGAEPRRVFLSLGRQELHVFASAPQHHYLARLIERPEQAHAAARPAPAAGARTVRPRRPKSGCCATSGSTSWSPRTPAAPRPTPRSRRRARSACRSS